MDSDIAGIVKIREQGEKMSFIVCEGVVLRNQHFLVLTIPATSPVFVGPAEAKGEIRVARVEDLSDRAL